MTWIDIPALVRIFVLLVAGIPFLLFIRNNFYRIAQKHISHHVATIFQKIIFFSGIGFIGISTLQELGFNITTLLGTAGIIGIALGFAAQTSVSNIISGIFLLIEAPFSLGDTISCNGITGIAESIDLLSIKIRTQTNTLVRLPNEMVLKNRLDTVTYYPTRCINFTISIPYDNSIDEIEQIIANIVKVDEIFLDDPKPRISSGEVNFSSFSSDIRIYFSVRVWTLSKNLQVAQTLLIKSIKSACDTRGITITITHNN